MAIGELVGGALLSSFLNVLFDRLASSEVLTFLKGQEFDVGLLDKLEMKMRSVSVLLDDAEEKQITNPHVKWWMNNIKNVIYQVEDLLDEIDYEAKRSTMKLEAAGSRSFRDKVRNFLASRNDRFQKRMEEILGRLEYLGKQKVDLKAVSGEKQSLQQTRITTSLQAVDQPGSFVRDHEKEVIIKSMLSDDANDKNDLGVILIWGMGGIGKTTLAKLIYNDNRVRENFELKAWACVSVESDEFKVIKLLLEDLVLKTSGAPSALQRKLKEKVTKKKFLIVLDDVWNQCSWEILLQALRFGARGSKIIVTSRDKDAASIISMSTVSHHGLQRLPDDDCWSIFKKYAFTDDNLDIDPDLEEIGRELVKKCEGLPLAITALGGLLRSRRNVEEWEKILKSDMWNIKNDSILPSLRLSYTYLPSHLKRCFAYCAIFPKDHPFEKDKLVRLWMAEGFLVQIKGNMQTEGKKEMKEIGDEYFDELVSRSFFQQTNSNNSIFLMHNLINDLAKFVSGEFCFCSEEGQFGEATEKTRHVCVSLDKYKFEVIHKAKLLRTFVYLDKQRLWDNKDIGIEDDVMTDSLSSFKCIRVLSLSYNSNGVKLSNSITNMKYLRFLLLSRTSIERLPDSVGKLYFLQTLILSQCYHFVELPESVGNLKDLRHLELRGAPIKMLPEAISTLHKLQILLLIECNNLIEMPTYMGKLTKLETLSLFIVGKQNGHGIEELGELQHLGGALSIWKLENVFGHRNAAKAYLNAKKHLKKLKLIWDNDGAENSGHEREILEQLKPHTNLEGLCIDGYRGTKFANWVGESCFSKMESLKLIGCKNCSFLPPLGQLPSLEQLLIKGFELLETVGAEFYGSCSSPFQSLRSLRFEEMRQWYKWVPYASEGIVGAFPQLQELHVSKCPNLTISMGLASHIPLLEKLEIQGCRHLVGSLRNTPAIRSMRLADDIHSVSLNYKSLTIDKWVEMFDYLLQEVVAACDMEKIEIKSCDSLEYFPFERFPKLNSLVISDCGLVEFPYAFEGPLTLKDVATSLRCLKIVNCPKLVSFSIRGFAAPNLKELQLRNCSNLKSLGGCMNSLLPLLQSLKIHDCPEIESFPEGGLPFKLQNLSIGGCKKLIDGRMQWHLQLLTSLLRFSIRNCEEVESFPEKTLLPSTLTSLRLTDIYHLEYLDHEGLQNLTSLQKLEIVGCPMIHSMPQEGLPSTLTSLLIRNVQNLKTLDHVGLQRLLSLKNLSIIKCSNLQSLADQGLPSSLTSLRLRNLPSLQSVDCLGLHHLTSLTRLEIVDCLGLSSLPEQGLPTFLSSLVINGCSVLEQRCEKNRGDDWPKIMHIPSIVINCNRIN